MGVGSSVSLACWVSRAATVAVAAVSGVVGVPSPGSGVLVGASTGVAVPVGTRVGVSVGGKVAVNVGVNVTCLAIAVSWASCAIAVLVALISAAWVCRRVSLPGKIKIA